MCKGSTKSRIRLSDFTHTLLLKDNIIQSGCLCPKSLHSSYRHWIKGYQEQIASLNSKCKMLTMKAKHATMLLTVTEVEGLADQFWTFCGSAHTNSR